MAACHVSENALFIIVITVVVVVVINVLIVIITTVVVIHGRHHQYHHQHRRRRRHHHNRFIIHANVSYQQGIGAANNTQPQACSAFWNLHHTFLAGNDRCGAGIWGRSQ